MRRPKFSGVEVSLKLPFVGELKGIWEAKEAERRAACQKQHQCPRNRVLPLPGHAVANPLEHD